MIKTNFLNVKIFLHSSTAPILDVTGLNELFALLRD
jgi:hypothetical protein